MKDGPILKTGIIGAAIAAICCATPILVITLGALGFSAWIGWLDYVLFPALGMFLGLIVLGIWLRRRKAACSATCPHNINEGA
jgi:mercuric ion transport protein